MVPPTLSAAILEGSKDSKQAIGRYFDDGRPGVFGFNTIWKWPELEPGTILITQINNMSPYTVCLYINISSVGMLPNTSFNLPMPIVTKQSDIKVVCSSGTVKIGAICTDGLAYLYISNQATPPKEVEHVEL